MTESEWLSSTTPRAMLGFLIDRRDHPRFTARPFRLFTCACLRKVWASITDRRSRQAIEAAEQYERGQIDRHRLEQAARQAEKASRDQWQAWQNGTGNERLSRLAAFAREVAEAQGLIGSAWNACDLLPGGSDSPTPALVREIFGNPFRVPALPDGWQRWNRGIILHLAQTMQEQRRYDDMPILGDALEEAGCVDEEILTHCRAASEHVLGCWVVDQLLKED